VVSEENREHGAVCNPVVLETSEEIQEGEEGCLSFPGLFYPLERPLRTRVSYRDLDGEEQIREASGMLARAFLHEIDHLNGILFIDHLARHDRKEALRRMREIRLDAGDSPPSAGAPVATRQDRGHGPLLRPTDG
jgi:peptide deformylase